MPSTEEKQEPPKTPQSLVKEEHVKIALAAQCGDDAVLRSWAVYDFANKGDNYACVVSSVMVTFTKYEKKHWTSFIVKLNPCRPLLSMGDPVSLMFNKEGNFYTIIVPELNKALESAGQTALKVPKCYYVHLEPHNEVLYLEDLRDDGFKMADRRQGLDVPHLILVLKELGRLHAASILFKGSKTRQEMLEAYPCLEEMFASKEMGDKPDMQKFFQAIIDGASKMVSMIEGYGDLAEEISKLDFYTTLRKDVESETNFEVICHGDCWTNNFLFKYDENGCPAEVRLLDLQITRVGSPGLDLNYLIYSSSIGKTRRNHLPTLLSAYQSNFHCVLACAGKQPLFLNDQLKTEFDSKNKFGFMMALMLIPMMVATSDEIPEFNDVKEEEIEAFMKEHQEKNLQSMKTNPLLRPRLLDMLDEMVENGVVANCKKV